MIKIKKRKKKAYSLVEILVTLAIFGFLSVVLLQTLLNNLMITSRINARTKIRTELEQVVSFIERDIRNADSINSAECKNNTIAKTYSISNMDNRVLSCSSQCTIKNLNGYVIWCYGPDTLNTSGNTVAVNKIFKLKSEDNTIFLADYMSSSLMNVERLDFMVNVANENLDNDDYTPYANILLTVEVSNNNLGINNQIRQTSITTRNYKIK